MTIPASSAARGSSLERFAAFLGDELAPYPGRVTSVARMATACVATMLVVMAFRIPNGFLAVFYVLAISRENTRATFRNGAALVLGNLAGLAAALAGIVFLIDYPLLHFLFAAATFFLAFFLIRTLVSYSLAFGFSIILVAATSVNIIWARPEPLRPDVSITLWTSFGMILGTLATVLTDRIFGSPGPPAAFPRKFRELFVADAFSNPGHQVFALKGCVAATISYLVWNGLAWPGLGVCTVTCVIAAPLPTVQSSRRRLTIRLAGLLTGGVICGIGSQIFILPYVDSIVGFAAPFAIVSAGAAWAVTSSPGFAYFGRQMALAYYLTMFQTWGANPSLATSRDRLTGIFLGLIVMWFVFDALSEKAKAPEQGDADRIYQASA